jgi:hypothetical protein
MARQQLTAEFNRFVGGLITEASPMNFPEGASLDEVNMVMNRDGTRQRRLGFDLETSYAEVDTGIRLDLTKTLGTSEFKWENAGGDPEKELLVVQMGNVLQVFDLDITPLSTGLIYTQTLHVDSYEDIFSYAMVDGLLVVATGLKDVNILEFDGTSTVTLSTDILYIRDLFGVEADNGTTIFTNSLNLEERPTTIFDTYLYNLRNQSWALPRKPSNGETVEDPITHFFAQESTYPSNSDTVNTALYPDANDTDNRVVDRFFAQDLIDDPAGSTRSPRGYFIIDAMERGVSRLLRETTLRGRYPTLDFSVSILPTDTTPGGAGVIAEYAGRIFYAGFSGVVTDKDANSPRMSSYVLFSRFIHDADDMTKCYQEADPTSKDDPDKVDTDGGFLRLDRAYGIKKMVTVGASLFVFASNGVWRIHGGSEAGFSANSHIVDKLTDHGIRGANSVVLSDDSLFYWGDDGIYAISQGEVGSWAVENISQQTIQTTYEDISIEDKKAVSGHYDSYERKIKWVYHKEIDSNEAVRELVFDRNLSAFTLNSINHLTTMSNFPKISSIFPSQPFAVGDQVSGITVVGDPVTVNGDPVQMTIAARSTSQRELKYVVVTSTAANLKYSFGAFDDPTFYDWAEQDGTGIDSPAYLLTGYIMAGDTQLDKQVAYLTTHFIRTEDGFDVNLNPENESSCLVQFQWEWTNSVAANKWSNPFQAYRYRQVYMPEDADDDYDTGYKLITTRNMVRGGGKVFSILFSSEAGKDMRLVGWALNITSNTKV